MPVLDFGGVEARVVLQSSKSFTRSYDLRVCTFDRARAAAEAVRAEGIEVDVLDTLADPRSPEALRTLISYLRRVRPDVLHSSISEANVLGLVAASFAGVRGRIAEEVGVPSHSWKGRIVMAGLYRRATRIVGVSEATCRYLIDVDRAPRESGASHLQLCSPSLLSSRPSPCSAAPGSRRATGPRGGETASCQEPSEVARRGIANRAAQRQLGDRWDRTARATNQGARRITWAFRTREATRLSEGREAAVTPSRCIHTFRRFRRAAASR